MTKDNSVATQNSESAMEGKTTLSRQRSFMSRQTQHKVEVKYVATKDEKNRKMNVATQKSMSQHNEELNSEIFIATMIKKWQ